MSNEKKSSITQSFFEAGIFISLLGTLGGLLLDFLKPLGNLAPYVLLISIFAALLYFLVLRKNKKTSNISRWEILAIGNIAVWALHSAFYFFTPPKGVLANKSDVIASLQSNLLSIEENILEAQKQNEHLQYQIQGIHETLEKKKSGFFPQPKSLDEELSNLQYYSMKSDFQNLKKTYENIIQKNPQYIDIIEDYIDFMKIQAKQDLAQNFLKNLTSSQNSPSIHLALILTLKSNQEKIIALRSFNKQFSQYPIGYYYQAWLISKKGLAKISGKDALEIKESIKYYRELIEKYSVANYFYQITLAKKKNDQLNKIDRDISSIKADLIERELSEKGTPIKIEISSSPDGSVTAFLVPKTRYYSSILYSIDGGKTWQNTGYLDKKDPMTGKAFPNTYIQFQVNPGTYNLLAKFLDFEGRESQIFSEQFEIH